MTATKRIKLFGLNGMKVPGSSKSLNQSIATFSFLAACAVAMPAPASAQLPTFTPVTPTNSGGTLPAPPVFVAPTGVNAVPPLPVPVPANVPVPPPAVPPSQTNPFPGSGGAAAPPLAVSDEAYTLGPAIA